MNRYVFILALLLLSACQTHRPTPPVAALLIERTAKAQAELQEVIERRLPGHVLIAEDIFAHRSIEFFTLKPRYGGALWAATPVPVHLVKQGRACLLQFSDNSQIQLQQVHCAKHLPQ